MKNPLYDIYEEIKACMIRSEELNIDTYEIREPATVDMIDEWEKKNKVKLPEGYRNLLLLTNGLNAKWCGAIRSINGIKKLEIPGYEGYYQIGGFVSRNILIDKNGIVYDDDEDFGMEVIEFEKILTDDILYMLKDQLRD